MPRVNPEGGRGWELSIFGLRGVFAAAVVAAHWRACAAGGGAGHPGLARRSGAPRARRRRLRHHAERSHKDAGTAGEFRGEYRFGDTLWFLAPFVGVSATTDGAAYGYFGFGFDVNFGPNWVLTPNGAAGVFERGSGTNLGSWWEFRTGAELAYRFADQSRLGVAVTPHLECRVDQTQPG